MNKRLILHIGVIIVLVTFLVASIIYTINHFAKANKEREEFKRLEDIVTINNNNNEGDTLSSSDEDSQLKMEKLKRTYMKFVLHLRPFQQERGISITHIQIFMI